MKVHSFIDQFEIFFSSLFFKCLFPSGVSSVYFKHCFCRLVSFLQGFRFSKTIGSYIVCFTFNFLSISGTAASLKFLLALMDIWLHYISLSLLCTNRCYRIMENRKSWWIGPWGLVDCVIITEQLCSSILVIIWSWIKMEKLWSYSQVWRWRTHDEAYSVLTGQWTRMIHQYGQCTVVYQLIRKQKNIKEIRKKFFIGCSSLRPSGVLPLFFRFLFSSMPQLSSTSKFGGLFWSS